MVDWWSFGFGAVTGIVALGIAAASLRLARKQEKRQVAAEERTERDRAAEEMAEASLITVNFRGASGTVTVDIVNNTDRPIRNVELLDLRPAGAVPTGGWTVAPRVPPSPTKREVLPQGATMQVFACLLDESGERIRDLPAGVEYRVRFSDASGQWWQLGENDQPRRIAPP